MRVTVRTELEYLLLNALTGDYKKLKDDKLSYFNTNIQNMDMQLYLLQCINGLILHNLKVLNSSGFASTKTKLSPRGQAVYM